MPHPGLSSQLAKSMSLQDWVGACNIFSTAISFPCPFLPSPSLPPSYFFSPICLLSGLQWSAPTQPCRAEWISAYSISKGGVCVKIQPVRALHSCGGGGGFCPRGRKQSTTCMLLATSLSLWLYGLHFAFSPVPLDKRDLLSSKGEMAKCSPHGCGGTQAAAVSSMTMQGSGRLDLEVQIHPAVHNRIGMDHCKWLNEYIGEKKREKKWRVEEVWEGSGGRTNISSSHWSLEARALGELGGCSWMGHSKEQHTRRRSQSLEIVSCWRPKTAFLTLELQQQTLEVSPAEGGEKNTA